MRVLALDYGSARCGCALSDPTGTIVTPIAPVERPDTRRGVAQLQRLVREHEVQRVVVGLPLSLRGQDTEQTRRARAFAEHLAARLEASVQRALHDDHFTTLIALPLGHCSVTSEDLPAAPDLLEDWLDFRAS